MLVVFLRRLPATPADTNPLYRSAGATSPHHPPSPSPPGAQTSASAISGSATPQGNLSAIGTLLSNSGFTQSFTEHGIIIGLANIRADLNYQQGMRRMWSRRTRYDFYFPAFAILVNKQCFLRKFIVLVIWLMMMFSVIRSVGLNIGIILLLSLVGSVLLLLLRSIVGIWPKSFRLVLC